MNLSKEYSDNGTEKIKCGLQTSDWMKRENMV
jgi:hypothetical protein